MTLHIKADGSTAMDASKACQVCGLCCDGTLFQRVKLMEGEQEKAKNLGMSVFERNGETYFSQNCPKLEGSCCSCYEDRPSRCADFHCLLAKDIMNGSITLEEAQKIISFVKEQTRWFLKFVYRKPDYAQKNTNILLRVYWDKAMTLNAQDKLSPKDKSNIKRIFEMVKFMDRYFAKTSLLTKYANLIQRFSLK